MRPSRDQVTVQRLIPAPASVIFDLLADPVRHQEIDGSGTVVKARSGAAGERRLGLGDVFGMNMDWGVHYATKNTVTEFEEDRLIAWTTGGGPPLSWVLGGRTWRYELEPHEDGTIVRETWDLGTEVLPSRPFVRRLAAMTRRNMSRTLERIEEIVTAQ